MYVCMYLYIYVRIDILIRMDVTYVCILVMYVCMYVYIYVVEFSASVLPAWNSNTGHL